MDEETMPPPTEPDWDEPVSLEEDLADLSFSGILAGLKETASHMLAEARAETSRAREEAWDRFESKTKNRRNKD